MARAMALAGETLVAAVPDAAVSGIPERMARRHPGNPLLLLWQW